MLATKSVFSRGSFKTVMLSRFLKVTIAKSNFMSKAYSGRLMPEVRLSMLKEFSVLVRNNAYETRKKKNAKLASKYM